MEEPRRGWLGDEIARWLTVTLRRFWTRRNRWLPPAVVVLILVGVVLGIQTARRLHSEWANLWQPEPSCHGNWVTTERLLLARCTGSLALIDAEAGTADLVPDRYQLPVAASNERGDIVIADRWSHVLVTADGEPKQLEFDARILAVAWDRDRWELITEDAVVEVGATGEVVRSRALPGLSIVPGTQSHQRQRLVAFWRKQGWVVVDGHVIEGPDPRLELETVFASGKRSPLTTIRMDEATRKGESELDPFQLLYRLRHRQGSLAALTISWQIELSAHGLVLVTGKGEEAQSLRLKLDPRTATIERRPEAVPPPCTHSQTIVDVDKVSPVRGCPICPANLSGPSSSRQGCFGFRIELSDSRDPTLTIVPAPGGFVFATKTAAQFYGGDEVRHSTTLLTARGKVLLLDDDFSRLRIFDENLQLESERRLVFSATLRLETLLEGFPHLRP
jgi:hypothetical protein